MDLALIPIETVEQLRRYTPSEQEVKVYKQYEKDKKPLDKLTDEDKLIYKVCSSITWSGFFSPESCHARRLQGCMLFKQVVEGILYSNKKISSMR